MRRVINYRRNSGCSGLFYPFIINVGSLNHFWTSNVQVASATTGLVYAISSHTIYNSILTQFITGLNLTLKILSLCSRTKSMISCHFNTSFDKQNFHLKWKWRDGTGKTLYVDKTWDNQRSYFVTQSFLYVLGKRFWSANENGNIYIHNSQKRVKTYPRNCYILELRWHSTYQLLFILFSQLCKQLPFQCNVLDWNIWKLL